MKPGDPLRVLFVCLGNICRSPTAHGVFASKVKDAGLAERVAVDSCGTAGWHIGSAPDHRATAEALRRGYDLSTQRARQLEAGDFLRFDYILAMDRNNMRELTALRPQGYSGHLGLLLDFAPQVGETEVPDPYYGGDDGFGHVLDLVELASDGLLQEVRDACRGK